MSDDVVKTYVGTWSERRLGISVGLYTLESAVRIVMVSVINIVYHPINVRLFVFSVGHIDFGFRMCIRRRY